MGPRLNDSALVHHQYAVTREHGRKSMRNNERGATLHQVLKRRLDQHLAFRIERRGGLVKEKGGASRRTARAMARR